MKPVYVAHCSFHGEAEENAARAWDLACAWLTEGTGFDCPGAVDQAGIGSQVLDGGHVVSWRVTEADDGMVARIVHDVPAGDDDLGWRTMVWICRDGDGAWGVVRGGPQNTEGVVTTLRFDAKRPRLLSSWLTGLHVVADGRRLGELALNYGQNDAQALLELLQRRTRRLPIVAISRAHVDGAQRPLMRPEGLAYRLAGNAHVIVLDHAGSWAVTDAIGKALSVYEGAVRVWWPGFSASDDPYRHTLVLGERVGLDPKRAEGAIVRRIWRAAVDALGPPPLEARVLAAYNRAETERRIDALRSASSDGGEWEELLQEQMDENVQLRDQVEELQADVGDLRAALVDAQTQVHEDEQDELDEVDSVEDAIKVAAGDFANVVFLQSAYEAARESKYPDPQQVLRDLRALGRVAEKWGKDELKSGFRGGFDAEPVTYREGISQTASTKYRSDYEIEFGTKRVLMGPHLRRGVGAPEAILRIYWYVDEPGKQLIVGHVGKKLRDKKNS